MTEQITLIENTLNQAVQALKAKQILPADWQNNSQVTPTKDPTHGDFASNIAMVSAKIAKMNPRQLAQQIVDAMPQNSAIKKIDIAGPGFINFFLEPQTRFAILDNILQQQEKFGTTDEFAGKKIQVEFVSANPTSALHIGHGRGAAFGMSVANLLEAVGYQVQREYYVNDAGRQMDILATSTFLRYLELCGETIIFPSNGYQGNYINDIANEIKQQYQDKFVIPWQSILENVPADAVYKNNEQGEKILISGDKEAHIDGLINQAKQQLQDNYQIFHQSSLNTILDDIKEDLTEFNVHFDQWFSEKSLDLQIEPVLELLDKKGFLYKKDGNVWFKSTDFGDEKDRVVRRANGQVTYFASDIAYHQNKLERGFDTIIDVWGADHHGYIARVKAALSALGYDADRLQVILIQFVSLWRGDKQVQMSSRSGQFVTLRELRQEVGNDAARFYYVARKPEQPIDFDLELAKSQSKDNAVYYIQYAHARICNVIEKLQDNGLTVDDKLGKQHQDLLTIEIESELLKLLAQYPSTLRRAATGFEPHILTNYLKDLTALFHSWYNDYRILPVSMTQGGQATENELVLMQARLRLSKAVQQVLANGLQLLGLSAPTHM